MGIRNISNAAQLQATLAGEPTYLGTIVATTVKTNANTAAPFTITAGTVLTLCPDTACYVLMGASVTCTANNGFPLAAGATATVCLKNDTTVVQCLAVSGTTNLKVFQLS